MWTFGVWGGGHKKHINRFPSGVMKGVRDREGEQ